MTANLVAMDGLPGKSSYFIGNEPAKWRTGVPSYSRVEYQGLYPGVDLVFYGNPQRLEHDFIVAPKADPDQIALCFDGAEAVQIDAQGNLQVRVAGGELKLQKPRIYQREGGTTRQIRGGYVLTAKNSVKFALGPYNRNAPLIVDPVLDYSTYLGGTSDDFGYGIAVDSKGDAFVTGQTISTDFPTTTNAVQTSNNSSGGTAFVTEINPTGTAILYSTYIGGSSSEIPTRIALDSANPPNVYITGIACSNDFPTTPNALIPQLTPTACTDSSGGTGFVTKFNPALSGLDALVYSTYLGGNGGTNGGGDAGTDIAVDETGNIYVTGATFSTDFPTTTGAFQTANKTGGSNENAFVTRIDPTKSGPTSLIYSTYLGGSTWDVAYGIAVDCSNNAYVAGIAASQDFPTTPGAYQQTFPPGGPLFVSRINTAKSGTSSLEYSTFVGGSLNGPDSTAALDIALGPHNIAYVTGSTFSPDYPVTPGAYLTTASNGVILTLIDTSKMGDDSLVYSTFLGPSSGDDNEGNGIAVDRDGNAYIGGFTLSTAFPVTEGAFQSSFSGCASGFVSKLRPLGNGAADLAYSTFFDGIEPTSSCTNGTFGVSDITLDSRNKVYITGITGATNFPTSPKDAYQSSLRGSSDSYVAKLSLRSKDPAPTISSLSIDFGETGSSVTISGANFNMSQGRGNVTFGEATAFIDGWSSTCIVALVPREGTPGPAEVAVHTSNGTSNKKQFTVVPSITTLSPSSGPAGTRVTIRGYNFGSAGRVKFNGVDAEIESWECSEVVAIVPGNAHSGNVVLTTNSTSSPAGTIFTVIRRLGSSGESR